eukprot:4649823-Karenia_brevis.AAC.1
MLVILLVSWQVAIAGIRVGETSHPGLGNEGFEAYAGWYGLQHTPGIPQAELAQQSTSKAPPLWIPDLELKGYPFR